MKTREELQSLLEETLGSHNVYHQSPPNTGMKYPCIVYRFDKVKVKKADNIPYMVTGRWEIHHMYKQSKNSLLEKMLFIAPYVTHDRQIVKEGIYNDYYTIYQ
jgi:hypothetical protein